MKIDESNWDQIFKEHFFDVRRNPPKRGQVMACYTAGGELIEGELKKDLVNLLCVTPKVHESILLLQKMACMEEKDAMRICREVLEDLKSGMTREEIITKPYKYLLRVFYYVESEYIPSDDPHWHYVEIKNLEEFIQHTEKVGNRVITSKIIKGEKDEGTK